MSQRVLKQSKNSRGLVLFRNVRFRSMLSFSLFSRSGADQASVFHYGKGQDKFF